MQSGSLKVCKVGAEASGFIIVEVLKQNGILADIFVEGSAIGGLWRHLPPAEPMLIQLREGHEPSKAGYAASEIHTIQVDREEYGWELYEL